MKLSSNRDFENIKNAYKMSLIAIVNRFTTESIVHSTIAIPLTTQVISGFRCVDSVIGSTQNDEWVALELEMVLRERRSVSMILDIPTWRGHIRCYHGTCFITTVRFCA